MSQKEKEAEPDAERRIVERGLSGQSEVHMLNLYFPPEESLTDEKGRHCSDISLSIALLNGGFRVSHYDSPGGAASCQDTVFRINQVFLVLFSVHKRLF